MEDCREKQEGFVLCGTFVHSTDEEPMVVLENHCLGVVDGKVKVISRTVDKMIVIRFIENGKRQMTTLNK